MIPNILSAIVFLPLLGAGFILLAPWRDARIHRMAALAFSLVTFVLSCVLIAEFNPDSSGFQFLEDRQWISSLKISYLLGVDGLSVTLIPLTALLFLLCVIATDGAKGFFALFLMFETAILGTFAALDLFLFFTFWGAALLPAYFMVGVWGNKRREYAATKFFLYQLAGAALLLLGLLAIYYAADPHSFSLIELAGGKFEGARIDIGDRSLRVEHLVFALMLLGFAVRLPIVPLHSWFPHIQAEAPAGLGVIFAAIFIKTGAYAVVRINYALFPEAANWLAPVLAMAGGVNVIYGGICALGQKDIRRLVAYSCISHMGFVLLGLAVFSSTAFQGAMLQIIAHAIYAGLLFFLVGILGARSGKYSLTNEDGSPGFGGLVSRAPVLTGFFTVAIFSALGVPGLGAFPSESLVLLGIFPAHRLLTVVGLAGIFLTAGYFLWLYRRLFLGRESEESRRVTDLTVREQLFLVPLIALCLLAGAYPTPLIELAQPTITRVLLPLIKDAK